MSYCRFVNGDAYIFENLEGCFECCGCWLSPDGGGMVFATREELLKHIDDHRQVGHHIPLYVDEQLREEIAHSK